jgi:hypothetical protein
LRVHEGSAEPRVLSQASVQVLPDPLLTLSDVEYRQLHDARMRALALQGQVARLVQRLDAARETLGPAEGQDSTSAAAMQAKQLRTDIDGLLTALRGAPRTASQGAAQATGSGGMGGAANQALFARVMAVTSAIGTAHFLPTSAQLLVLDEAAQELETVGSRVSTVIAATDSLLRDFAIR